MIWSMILSKVWGVMWSASQKWSGRSSLRVLSTWQRNAGPCGESFETSHSTEHTSVPPHSELSGDDGGQHPPHPHFPTHYQPAHTLSPTCSWFSNMLYHLIILISLSYNMSMLLT